MWPSIELLAHALFYICICTTRGSLPHVVIIISAYCITISLSSACAYKPGFTVHNYIEHERLIHVYNENIIIVN